MNRRVLLSGLGATLAMGCTAAPPAGDGLISLAPQITETVAALGALQRLIGRSDWCRHPAEVLALPALGSALTPDLERIAALRPAAILIDASRGGRVDALRGLARVETLPWLSVDEIAASVLRLGALLDRREAAAALAARYAALNLPEPTAGPAVLLVLANDTADAREIWFMKRNSVHGSALHAAGGRNVVDHDVEGAPVLSLEALIALDPPAIFVLTESPIDEALSQSVLAWWARLDALTAVKQRRVTVVGGPQSMSSGPSIFALVRALEAELARLK